MAGDVGGIGALHQLADGAVVSAIEFFVVQRGDLLVNLCVVIDVLFQIEVVLLGVVGLGNKLPVDGLEHLTQHGLHLRQQIVGRVTAHLFDAGVVQAKTVTQLGGHHADRHVRIAAGGQTVHRQRLNDAQSHLLVGRPHAVADAIFKRVADVNDFADALITAQHRVVANFFPVKIEGDQTGPVGWHFLVNQAAN